VCYVYFHVIFSSIINNLNLIYLIKLFFVNFKHGLCSLISKFKYLNIHFENSRSRDIELRRE